MIEYRKGDLLGVTEGVIAHGVNCQGVMGSGVALAIKKKYPRVFKYYNILCESEKTDTKKLLGRTLIVRAKEDESTPMVANCFTQNFYGTDKRHVNYEAVAESFASLYKHYNTSENPDMILHIPKIGAGLGGGNWEIISRIIEDEYKGKIICWELP